MALEPRITILQNLITGSYFTPSDSTGTVSDNNPGGYGTPNPDISDIEKVRFLFSSYLTEQNANDNITYCYPSREYEVYGNGTGSVTVDTKILFTGDIFILQVDAEPVIEADLFIRETGRFAALPSFIPTSLVEPYSSLQLTPSECGIDSLIFPDSACELTYELYGTAFSAGNIAAGIYIVKGTLLVDTAVVNTVVGRVDVDITYNVGEVVVIPSNTTFTGSAQLCALMASTENTFPLYFEAWQTRTSIESVAVENNCGKGAEYDFALFQVSSRIEAININYDDELNNDASGTQTLLESIQRIYINLTEHVSAN